MTARPEYIYIAIIKGALGGDPPIAAFTVKSELTAWASSVPYSGNLDFYQIANGVSSKERPVKITIQGLLRSGGFPVPEEYKMKRKNTIMADFSALNSATKYPSIDTYHVMDPANGTLTDAVSVFTGRVVLTEKIDGTNGRIVITPDGDWFIGSREELLYARGDRMISPAMGIVPALLPLAARGFRSITGFVQVLFFEVYGHRIGPAAKQYTSTGKTGYRLFDTAIIPAEVLSWSAAKIAAWRDGGGQQWAPESSLQARSAEWSLPLTPRLGTVNAAELPVTLNDTAAFLRYRLPRSLAGLDASAGTQPEGIVLRTEDRSLIAKAKFSDYERTLRRRAMQGKKPGR